ncbi:MAG: 3-oxoacyl-ACP reductase FabG [Candidatus Competibacter sp.]|nr:3-oxoacyl-ACP reductase FabG [Candidatus Competibacter sp.]MDG4583118.1 3-oxoacyl-ACP reductase FabG [Candidatus Competibacter sp.]
MKRALVTGGSGDLGRAICQRLGRDGLHVIVHARQHPERAAAAVEAIRAAGGSAEAVAFDVADEDQVRQALTRLLQAGPIQVLVNNAGVHADAPMAGMSGIQWRQPIEVCLHGFFNVTQPLLLPMLGTRWGRIVNISSLTGVIGNRGQTNYAAAKAGLHGATKALALELASRGITVNAIAPGIIESQAAEAAFDAAAIRRLVPMQRAGTPDEVAALVGFLASEEAGYLTGQIIGLNGGIA